MNGAPLARAEGIPARHLTRATHPDPAELDAAMPSELVVNSVDLILLAGYMRRIGAKTLPAFHEKILNVHPALLPRHGGHGTFGMRVHEAVLAAGDSVTGVSVHMVDEHYDHGTVIAQEELPVVPGDDASTLAARVRAIEHRLLVDTIAQIARGEVASAPRPSTEQCSPE